MRVGPIQHSNNINFKAHFKKAANSYFDDLFEKTTDLTKLKKLTKELKEKTPNHELEIIGKKFVKGHEINWRDSIPDYQYYLVRNNNNGNSLWICAPSYYEEDHLISVVDTLVNSGKQLKKDHVSFFWRDNDESKEVLDKLTTPNTGQKQNVSEQNYDDLPLKEKIKSFLDFWFKF